MGMIQAPDTIWHGPQLSNGKKLCLAFAVKGKSCPNGFHNCANAHVSMHQVSVSDLQAIDRWVASTANVTWYPRRPFRLTQATTTATSPVTPVTSTTANPVSPPPAPGAGTQAGQHGQ